ncbi:hypothetical protein BPODLACK_00210 [Gordonia sp. YY1]|nr:GNAT family N-acetyltransferase [Gordonia sp. 1D]KAF0971027.1 hypothetical protein BPODLACK_00210 [Gordonia sp. YY1]MBA5846908.1 GNAT family N-acetyltransferase [Gordonia amicalis]NKX78787.1 GNAT family N-acetyltransferase [Gordonia amicalis]
MTKGILASVNGARLLTESDREDALDLLETGLREVPAYRWVLGEEAPAHAYRWYGEVLFAENLAGMYGVFDESGRLIALAAISEPGRANGIVDADLKERNRYYVRTLDGFVERFTEFRRANAEASVADESIGIIFGLVHPDHRRSGVLSRLVDAIVEKGRRQGLPVTAGTADPVMSAVYTRRWKSVVRAEYTLTDGPTVWVHRVDPPADAER